MSRNGLSGSFIILLRKGPDGRFLKSEIGKTAFRIESYDSANVIRTYVRYRLADGFPTVNATRAGLAAFGPDSGIERYKFHAYLTEAVILKILAEKDSAPIWVCMVKRSGKGLFALPRKNRVLVAGESMYDLVRLGCGLQGLEFGMAAKEADALA